MRQSWLGLLVALLVACAGRNELRPASAIAGGGELHDAAAEWNADNRAAFQTEPWRPPRRSSPAPSGDAFFEWPSLTEGVFERSRKLQPIVRAAARAHSVPKDVVNGIIWVESRFLPHARSEKGACGLMQIMPRTGREVARVLGMRYEPYDPEFNIHAGTYYFARMVDRFRGNAVLALAAYNAGPARVETWLRDERPLPSYSRAYAYGVLSAARVFRAHLR